MLYAMLHAMLYAMLHASRTCFEEDADWPGLKTKSSEMPATTATAKRARKLPDEFLSNMFGQIDDAPKQRGLEEVGAREAVPPRDEDADVGAPEMSDGEEESEHERI